MQPVTASDMLDKCRVLLNDTEAQMYTNDVLLPYIQMAYDDLRLAVQNYNIPITNSTSALITLPANARSLGSDGNPPLPTDLVEVLSVNERPAGTQNDFLLMERRDFLPLTDVHTSYLGLWSWQNQVIRFIGATGDIELKLNYISDSLGTIINEDSVIFYYNCRNYLQYRTAGLAAEFTGENSSRAESLNSNAQMMVDLVINQGVKTKQAVMTRRQPFGARRKARGFGW